MIRNIFLAAVFLVIAACSGSTSVDDPPPANPAPATPSVNPDTNPGITPATPADPGTSPIPQVPTTPGANPVEPSGTTAGVWTGPTDFGTGVYVIDSAQNLYGFSSNGNGQFKSVFGTVGGLIERYDHRAGDNPALGDAPTIVGDPDAEFASLSYLFALTEDGRNLFNTSALGEFTMALADDNSIAIADIAGNWESKTSFCDSCPLALNITVTAEGLLTGSTSFGEAGALDPANEIPLSGSLSGSGQFLQVEFNWDGKVRTGVVYRDFGTEKLMLNTVGVESEEAGNRAFSALLSRSSSVTAPTVNPDPTTTTPVPTTPEPQAISATGTWSGLTDFGMGVYIIDAEQNLYGFSSDGAGNFKSMFGPVSGLIERYNHRTSENPALGEAYTIVGDPDQEFANLSYQFTLAPDGLNLTNTSALGSFTMALVGDNTITVADVVGNWSSRTAFCPTCPSALDLSIQADGAITGSTSFGLEGSIDPTTNLPLAGTLTEAGQYLGISFNWDGKVRTGVIYREAGTQKLVLNTHGVESAADGNRSFSALLTRQ